MSGQGSREKEKEKGATNGEVTPVGNSSQHNTDYDYLIKFLALGIIFRAHLPWLRIAYFAKTFY